MIGMQLGPSTARHSFNGYIVEQALAYTAANTGSSMSGVVAGCSGTSLEAIYIYILYLLSALMLLFFWMVFSCGVFFFSSSSVFLSVGWRP